MQMTYNIDYRRHPETGLIAATSPDLSGFMVVARSLDDVINDVPFVAADLIRKQTGEVVEVYWDGGDESCAAIDGFLPIVTEVRTRKAA